MTEPRLIRDATPADAEACAGIYRPYVSGTAITFETEPPATEVMATRISSALAAYAWLVLEEAGGVVGYAYGGQWKARAAYRWTCEVSVYLEIGRRRSGAGRALYEALLLRLSERGYLVAVAGMTLPNEASVGLHRALGFEDVGVNRRVGWKNGAWHDVAWAQRSLGPQTGEQPPEPA